jgi:hypothetical protein
MRFFMPFFPRDLIALAIITELQAYGFDVVGQELCGAEYYNRAALREFYQGHRLDQAAAFIWLSQSRFGKIMNERLASGQEVSFTTGWLFFAGMPCANSVGQAMAERLNNGNTITLTFATAKALKAAWSAEPPLYCSPILRAALWLCMHKVLWSKQPLMIALRHNARKAKLWHLRLTLVANLFVPPHLRRT